MLRNATGHRCARVKQSEWLAMGGVECTCPHKMGYLDADSMARCRPVLRMGFILKKPDDPEDSLGGWGGWEIGPARTPCDSETSQGGAKACFSFLS